MATAQDRTAKQRLGRCLPALGIAIGIAIAPPTAALAAILLLPTMMAWVADANPGRPTVRAVVLFGLAASCGPFDVLWRSGNRIDTTIMLISDLRVIALAWSAQAGAWLMTQLLPLVIAMWLEAETRLALARLQTRHQALKHEWADEADA